MSGVFKGYSKTSKVYPGLKSGIAPPNIRVEETPRESHEGLFRNKAKGALENILSIPPSLCHAASLGPSSLIHSSLSQSVHENSNSDDKNRSVETKNDPGESLKPGDRRMGSGNKASEEAIVDTEDQSLMKTTWGRTAEQTPQDSIWVSKHQVQAMCTIDGGVSSQQLDKGKSRDNQDEGLAVKPRHPRHYYNFGTPDDCEISRNKSPEIGVSSEQENYISPSDATSQCQGAHHVTIGGRSYFENNRIKNEYYYVDHGRTYDITILKEFVSFRALYNSSAQDPTCRAHPGTRQCILKRIRDWIDTPSAKEHIFWLHGPAGVGKSAIAQTIARSCAKGELAGTFFFYRSDPSRNDGNRLFTTLAWQFAYVIPATKNVLIHALNECPDIPMTDVETQFEQLIIKPCLELKRAGVQLLAPVVIIDGVDECSDDNLQRRFLKIIGNAVRDDRVPLRFLICSRPEAHIQDTIDLFRSVTLSLDLAKLDDANQDIEKYFRAEFSRIATEQDLDPTWPGEEIIQELVYKASGQFIYASTVIKYVGDEYSSAESQLDIILGLKSASSISPFGELDELYMEILRRQRDPVFLKDFLSLFIGRNGTELDDLDKDDAMLMNVSEKELHRKLRGMRSLLKFKPTINVHHRSFLDFLQDSSRSGQYHISKEAGTRRYLDLIASSLVWYASTIIDRQDNHKTHFNPQFHYIFNEYPAKIDLLLEDWQQALQPLLDLQNKLLTSPNFLCTWGFLPCKMCTGFHTMRNLLLHLTFLLGASNHVLHSALMSDYHHDGDGSEEIHCSAMPLSLTEADTNVLETDLNACLSSLLPRLRRRKLGLLLCTDTIQLVCSLLRFDRTEIAMRLWSIVDAQNLVDVIDELSDNKYFCSDYSADISCKAVHLAMEIYARAPVLPRSLFSKGTVGPHHEVWYYFRDHLPSTEELSQTAFMCKILDPGYIIKVSWIYEDTQHFFVVGKANENKESLNEWRERLKPSSGTIIQVILEVAKALRYFHSMGIVLHHYVVSDDIFLDSEFHTRFRFHGLTTRYINMTPDRPLSQQWLSHEATVFFFGCLFYEMCFDVKISLVDRDGNNSNAVAMRPSKLEICDVAWQLIQRCCAKEAKNRPKISEVVREMEAWDIT